MIMEALSVCLDFFAGGLDGVLKRWKISIIFVVEHNFLKVVNLQLCGFNVLVDHISNDLLSVDALVDSNFVVFSDAKFANDNE